jgi:beta-glucosidase
MPQPAITSAPPGPPVMNFPEGPNAGYRWFEARKLAPQFPFGFGLSYASFTYANLSVKGGSTLTADFDVRNTSTIAGKTVAELYATPPSPDGSQVARLIGWRKVDLQPGEAQHLTVTADPRLVAHFDTPAHTWRITAGDYSVGLGNSSTDILANASAHLDAATIRP